MKKIILFGTIFLLLISALCIIKKIEKNAETSVREKISAFPFEIKNIKYNLLSDTLLLEDFSLKIPLQQDETAYCFCQIKDISIQGINKNLEEIPSEIISIFKELQAHDFLFALYDEKKLILSMFVDTYKIHEYSHNVQALFTEYQKNPFTTEFFTALLDFKHKGVEKIACTFNFSSSNLSFEDETKMNTLFISKAFLAPMDNAKELSLQYDGIQWNRPHGTIKGEKIEFNNIQVPNPKIFSELASLFHQHYQDETLLKALCTWDTWNNFFEEFINKN